MTEKIEKLIENLSDNLAASTKLLESVTQKKDKQVEELFKMTESVAKLQGTLRNMVQDLSISFTTLHKVLVDKSIMTEEQFTEASKEVVKMIQDRMDEMKKQAEKKEEKTT